MMRQACELEFARMMRALNLNEFKLIAQKKKFKINSRAFPIRSTESKE